MWYVLRQRNLCGGTAAEVDQVWAEAYTYWLLGEPLYMTKEEEQLAEEMQERTTERHLEKKG